MNAILIKTCRFLLLLVYISRVYISHIFNFHVFIFRTFTGFEFMSCCKYIKTLMGEKQQILSHIEKCRGVN